MADVHYTDYSSAVGSERAVGSKRAVGSNTLAPAGAIIHAGRRHPVDGAGATIGRGEDSDVVVDDPRASRLHARVAVSPDGSYVVEDLGSRHGTLVNDEPLGQRPSPLRSGDRVTIGDTTLRFLLGDETRLASGPLPVTATQTVAFHGPQMSLGRDESNDVVLADVNVSRFHAELVSVDGAIEVSDLGSRNGTRVNGERVQRTRLRDGDEIGIGPFGIVFDGQRLIARNEQGALRLEASEVSVTVKGRQILTPTSLAIEPGELVAIIGESGAGKSTLLKAIAGVSPASGGEVTINREPLANRLTDVGYVPQDDIVHRLLTVDEALHYAARLRLPRDAKAVEIGETVSRVLAELSLDGNAQQQIGSLSGGQRKRTSVATELLGRPSLLFLDEPTTGMDPALESRMMQLFRRLADRSRAVVVVTHATKNLALCDRIVVMARGGVMAFEGSPEEALEFFGAESYDGIYDALDETASGEWRAQYERSRRRPGERDADAASGGREPAVAPARPRGRVLAQTLMLTGRYLKLLVRDRRNLLLLVGQAPILAIAAVGLFRSGLFKHSGGSAQEAIELLFLMSLTMIWLGSIDGGREIIKERSVFERESAEGLRLSSYVLSKVVVLFGVITMQVVLNAGVLLAFRPLDEPASAYLAVGALLILTGFAGVCMGLFLSSVSTSEDQAMSLLPLALIPQLLFGGTIVTVARMAQPAKAISSLIFERWSLAGLGTAVGMNGRMAHDPQFGQVNPFGTRFFDVRLVPSLLIQAAFAAAFLAAVTLILWRRRSPAR